MAKITIKNALEKSLLATKEYIDKNKFSGDYNDLENQPINSLPIHSYSSNNRIIFVEVMNLEKYKWYKLDPKDARESNSSLSLAHFFEDGTFKNFSAVSGGSAYSLFFVQAKGTNTITLRQIDAAGGAFERVITIGADSASSTATLVPLSLSTLNEKEFIPTKDYQPATKKYVDDNNHIKYLTDAYGTATAWKVDINSMKAGFDYKFPPDATNVLAIAYRYIDSNHQTTTKNLVVFTNSSGKIPVIHMYEKVVDSKYVIMIGHELKVQLDVVDNGDGTKSVTVTKTPLTLSVSNEIEYTPTGDYHPATKKYIDDTVATAVTSDINGLSLWTGTKAEYDALTSKSDTTLYFIKEG